jgi:hypothetical protein
LGEEGQEEGEEEGEEWGEGEGDDTGDTAPEDLLDLLGYENVRFRRLELLQDQLGRVLGAERELLQLPDASYISLRQLQIVVQKLMLLMGQFAEKLGLQDIDQLLLYNASFSVEPPEEPELGALGLQLPGSNDGGGDDSLGERAAGVGATGRVAVVVAV